MLVKNDALLSRALVADVATTAGALVTPALTVNGVALLICTDNARADRRARCQDARH